MIYTFLAKTIFRHKTENVIKNQTAKRHNHSFLFCKRNEFFWRNKAKSLLIFKTHKSFGICKALFFKTVNWLIIHFYSVISDCIRNNMKNLSAADSFFACLLINTFDKSNCLAIGFRIFSKVQKFLYAAIIRKIFRTTKNICMSIQTDRFIFKLPRLRKSICKYFEICIKL